jgi:hypothetical protein
MRKVKSILLLILFIAFSFALTPAIAEGPTPETVKPTAVIRNDSPTKVYIAEVSDAAEMSQYSKVDYANSQPVTITIQSGDKIGTIIDTFFTFPNPQFQEPLKTGEKVLVGSVNQISQSDLLFISKYRQNNLLVWISIIIGLFLLVSGFRTNLKYLQIFLIVVVSGIIAVTLYHQNTYLVFGAIFGWQLIATIFFSYRIFRSRAPSIILSLSLLINQFIVLGIIFIMKSIQLYDVGFFDLFFSSSYDARSVMIYIVGILALYPITVVFAEQIISDSIKKKREENDILRIRLVQFASKSSLKSLTNIYLTLFGMFFSVFAGVIAIASRENVTFQVINSASLSEFLSFGLLFILDLLIFVPIVAFIAGIWLGKLETHQLITDRNVRQLEL